MTELEAAEGDQARILRGRIAELERSVLELAEVRRRLFEVEQELAELPELRARSERLAELESDPLLRGLSRLETSARLRARSARRSRRIAVKRLLGAVAERLAGRRDRGKLEDQPGSGGST